MVNLLAERIRSGVKMVRSISDPRSSYYPSAPRKGKLQIIWELALWRICRKEMNKYYNLYGFDVAEPGRTAGDYIDLRSFRTLVSRSNQNGSNTSQIVLLRDKYLFFRHMESYGFPVPRVFGVSLAGRLMDAELHPVSLESVQGRRDYFVKEIDGQCGLAVKHIGDSDELARFLDSHKSMDLVFQEKVAQHPEMNRLYSGSVNTIRIVTVMREGKPVLFSSLLRIGTKQTGELDNTSRGGIAVGILEDGTLMQYGFRKPSFGGCTDRHPDSGVVFSSFRIPYYQEAVRLACQAHEKLYRVRSIGWDIAITESGCTFIEGNDNWEIQSFQGIYGGMKEKCLALLS